CFIGIQKLVFVTENDELIAYLTTKQKSVGYNGKKAKVFSTDEIKTFIDEARDNTHLLIKVVLILGVMGACRRQELHDLKFDDVKVLGSSLLFYELFCNLEQ
ncbi:hypothetical protein C0J52_26097, partial [Blattella germanica]